MYSLELVCEVGHSFEGWYDSAEDYEAVLSRGELSCPVCDSEFIMRKSSADSPAGKNLMNLARKIKKDELGDVVGNLYFKLFLD